MSEDKPEKPKQTKVTWGAIVMVIATAAGSGFDAYRSNNERDTDVLHAAHAEANRVAVDKSIQAGMVTSIGELHDKIELLDRKFFERGVEIRYLRDRYDDQGDVDDDFREFLMLEALESEAKKENHVIRVEMPTSTAYGKDPEPPEKSEATIKRAAKRISKKKRPVFDFVEPEQHYQQLQQQVQQHLPPPPRMPKLKKR